MSLEAVAADLAYLLAPVEPVFRMFQVVRPVFGSNGANFQNVPARVACFWLQWSHVFGLDIRCQFLVCRLLLRMCCQNQGRTHGDYFAV